MWYVYMLLCKDGSIYTGITNDLDKRLIAHKNGSGSKYTRSRGIVELIYSEVCADRSKASKREAEIKRLKRSEKLELVNKRPS